MDSLLSNISLNEYPAVRFIFASNSARLLHISRSLPIMILDQTFSLEQIETLSVEDVHWLRTRSTLLTFTLLQGPLVCHGISGRQFGWMARRGAGGPVFRLYHEKPILSEGKRLLTHLCNLEMCQGWSHPLCASYIVHNRDVSISDVAETARILHRCKVFRFVESGVAECRAMERRTTWCLTVQGRSSCTLTWQSSGPWPTGWKHK